MTLTIGNLVGFRGRSVQGDWRVPGTGEDEDFSLNLRIACGSKGDLRVLIATGPEYYSELAESVLKFISETVNPAMLNGILISAHDFAVRISELKGSDKPMYPGWPKGSFIERVAFEILHSLLGQVDYALFLEGPKPGVTSFPHAALYSTDEGITLSCHSELLKTMGHDLMIEKEGIRGSLLVEVQREFGIPSLVGQMDDVEITYNNEAWLKEKVLNFLAYVGLINVKPLLPEKTYFATLASEVRSEYDGEISFDRSLGELVTEGERVGTIVNEDMQFQKHVENPRSGYIVSHRQSGPIAVEDVIYSLLSVKHTDEDQVTFVCDSLLDNTQMDANFRPNRLFEEGFLDIDDGS
jgi:hypothetical protein